MEKDNHVGSHEWFLQLKRMNTPTIYNGWEQVTSRNSAKECFNQEETRDFMPEMGVMVGRAVTVVIEPSNEQHKINNPNAFSEYYDYLGSIAGPKIVLVQDLDKPHCFGAFWGEVTANSHRNLGCVGGIIDGAIRDLDEMKNAGFKALARRLAVGHAHSVPIKWGCEVEVFGTKVKPGDLIHADKHGFMAIPEDDWDNLLFASRKMDQFECETLIAGARNFSFNMESAYTDYLKTKASQFGEKVYDTFRKQGEW